MSYFIPFDCTNKPTTFRGIDRQVNRDLGHMVFVLLPKAQDGVVLNCCGKAKVAYILLTRPRIHSDETNASDEQVADDVWPFYKNSDLVIFV